MQHTGRKCKLSAHAGGMTAKPVQTPEVHSPTLRARTTTVAPVISSAVGQGHARSSLGFASFSSGPLPWHARTDTGSPTELSASKRDFDKTIDFRDVRVASGVLTVADASSAASPPTFRASEADDHVDRKPVPALLVTILSA